VEVIIFGAGEREGGRERTEEERHRGERGGTTAVEKEQKERERERERGS